MIEYRRTRLIEAPPEEIWPIASDPLRLPEWFEGIDAARMLNGDAELGRHAIEGPWGEKRFEIVRVVEEASEGSRISWRDESELLNGEAPEDFWHVGSWFDITLEARESGTEVTVTGRQCAASPAWHERLLGAAKATGERLDASLQRLAALVERSG